MLQSENIMLGLLEVSWGWVGPEYKAKYFLSRAGERHCMMGVDYTTMSL